MTERLSLPYAITRELMREREFSRLHADPCSNILDLCWYLPTDPDSITDNPILGGSEEKSSTNVPQEQTAGATP